MALNNKTCVVTGSTSGIGLAAAERLAGQGARVIGVGRNPERIDAALKRIKIAADAAGAPEPSFEQADLSSLGNTRALADQLLKSLKSLDVLVNCAGVFTARRTLTPEGLETQFTVNHLAPFLLSTALLPSLSASPDGGVIVVSSAGRIRSGGGGIPGWELTANPNWPTSSSSGSWLGSSVPGPRSPSSRWIPGS